MAWTSEDLEAVEEAIRSIIGNKRVRQTEVGGKTRSFQQLTLSELYALRADMQAEVGDIPLRTYAKNGGAASC